MKYAVMNTMDGGATGHPEVQKELGRNLSAVENAAVDNVRIVILTAASAAGANQVLQSWGYEFGE